jgi:TPR repeat protein
MDKPWYRKLFSHSPQAVPEAAQIQADRANADVQFGLGLRFANGKGAGQDYAQAAIWYLKAAEQSHCMAQFNLGMMYSKGQGVQQNDDTAVTWILKAANQGDAGAQFVLGVRHLRMSFEGIETDVLESKIEACKWFHLATAQGYRGSQDALNSLTFGMTQEAVTEANRRASVFLAGLPPARKDESTTNL